MSASENERIREIVAAVLSGEASELERRLLKSRRRSDPSFDREVAEIERIWAVSRREVARPEPSAPPPPEPIIAEAVSSPARNVNGSSRRSWTKGLALRGSAAAGLIIALGAAIWTFGGRTGDSRAPQLVLTGAQEVVTVALEDGTMVRLAPNSRLEFGASRRAVSLTGRAFFAVTHSNDEPFRVQLPERTITVLGTRFDAEARDGQSRVAVLEGAVRISGNGPVLTARTDEVVFGPDRGTLVIQRIDDIYQTVDWLGTFLAFEDTPLSAVAQELGDRFDLRISIVDTVLASRTVTGWFTDQAPEAMIPAICTAVGARCVIEGSNVRIGPMTGVAQSSHDGSRP